jgi:protein-tyrosine phosphatase
MLSAIESSSTETVKKCSSIIPGMYVSGLQMANNPADLAKHKILTIIRCRSPASAKHTAKENEVYANRPLSTREFISKRGITEHVVTLHDSPKADIGEHFREAIDVIHASRLRGHNVLVHCDMGISRSVTIFVAYLIWLAAHSNHKIPTVAELIASVRAKRSIAKPNPGFVNTLGQYRNAWCVMRHKTLLARHAFAKKQVFQPTIENLVRHAGALIAAKFTM